MNPHKTIEPYKEEIVLAIEKITLYTRSLDLPAFIKNMMAYDATMLELILIGELSSKIPDYAKDQNKEIPWNKIIGLRNRIAHDYFSLSEEVLWEIITKDLPKLKIEIQKLHD